VTQEALATKEDQAIMIREGASLFFNVAKFEHAQRVARVFAESTMVPGQFKGNIGNCVIALNFAERMHVDPFMLMQNMYIVHGRPGVEAKLAIALINGSGKFTDPLEFEMEGEGTDKQKCRAYGTREGTKKVVYGPWVTWQMVVDEGWNKDKTNRTTGEVIKSKWNTLRDLMFNYRAAMFFARLHCPEVLLGLQTTEEILDFVDLERQANGSYQMAIDQTKKKAEDLKERLKGETGEEKTEADKDPIREQYIRLKRSGFKAWVMANVEGIPTFPKHNQEEITLKWVQFYGTLAEGDTYPWVKAESPQMPQDAPPEKENEDNPEENPQDFGEPDEEEQTESGEVEIPDEAKKILNLVDGAHIDIAGRPSVPCPNRDGRSVFPGVVCNECDQRVGCPTWTEYDKAGQ